MDKSSVDKARLHYTYILPDSVDSGSPRHLEARATLPGLYYTNPILSTSLTRIPLPTTVRASIQPSMLHLSTYGRSTGGDGRALAPRLEARL